MNININGIPNLDTWYSLYLSAKNKVNEDRVQENNKQRLKPILKKFGYLEEGDDEDKVGDGFSKLLLDVRSKDSKKSDNARKCFTEMREKK